MTNGVTQISVVVQIQTHKRINSLQGGIHDLAAAENIFSKGIDFDRLSQTFHGELLFQTSKGVAVFFCLFFIQRDLDGNSIAVA